MSASWGKQFNLFISTFFSDQSVKQTIENDVIKIKKKKEKYTYTAFITYITFGSVSSLPLWYNSGATSNLHPPPPQPSTCLEEREIKLVPGKWFVIEKTPCLEQFSILESWKNRTSFYDSVFEILQMGFHRG